MKLLLVPALALTAACTASADTEAAVSAGETAEATLGARLAGRVAGEPVSCVSMRNIRGSRIHDENTIVFEAGSTLYVNRTRGACPSGRMSQALRYRTSATSLCSGEMVSVFDPTTGVEYGGCSLGEFTPYRRAN